VQSREMLIFKRAFLASFVWVLVFLGQLASAFLVQQPYVEDVPCSVRRKSQSPQRPSRTTTEMVIEDMVGTSVEAGGFFDPLGLAKDEVSLYRRRCVELKHGRVAMLGIAGIIIQHFYQFPGPAFVEGERPLAALHKVANECPVALVGPLLLIGVFELGPGRQEYYGNKAPGELGPAGPLFALPAAPARRAAMELRELKHGRLAMLSLAGMLVAEGATGLGPVEALAAIPRLMLVLLGGGSSSDSLGM